MPLVARHRRGCGSISDRIQIVEEVRLTRLRALLTNTWRPLDRRRRGGRAVTPTRFGYTPRSRFVDRACRGRETANLNQARPATRLRANKTMLWYGPDCSLVSYLGLGKQANGVDRAIRGHKNPLMSAMQLPIAPV